MEETRDEFPCFGGRVTVVATDGAPVAKVRARLEQWHHQLTRFDPTSELSLLNAHPGERVRVSAIMACFVGAAIDAAHRTDGLVDPTLLPEIEAAGYNGDLAGEPLPLPLPLVRTPSPRPARPHPARRWLDLDLDPMTRTVTRPPGVKLDSGGVAKGVFADLAAELLSDAGSYAVNCGGDIRIGGRDAVDRPVLVDDPFGRGAPLHEFALAAGGVATSGIGRRSWVGPDGLPAHHLLDPSTGRPAHTGVVQATALAPTATDAEVRAKAALLTGGEGAREWLRYGGVLVFDDGSHMVVERP
ncbi:MAG: FAD:protein transferase [Thermoleophilaceae bacterium]|nr:FAD:protein transferase [Thermoleophilaceae bacterium]